MTFKYNSDRESIILPNEKKIMSGRCPDRKKIDAKNILSFQPISQKMLMISFICKFFLKLIFYSDRASNLLSNGIYKHMFNIKFKK